MVAGSVEITLAAGHADVARAGSDREGSAAGQLQLQVEASPLVVAPGEIQDPEGTLLLELWLRGFVQAIGFTLGVAMQSLVNNCVGLLISTRGNGEVAAVDDDLDLGGASQRLGK